MNKYNFSQEDYKKLVDLMVQVKETSGVRVILIGNDKTKEVLKDFNIDNFVINPYIEDYNILIVPSNQERHIKFRYD